VLYRLNAANFWHFLPFSPVRVADSQTGSAFCRLADGVTFGKSGSYTAPKAGYSTGTRIIRQSPPDVHTRIYSTQTLPPLSVYRNALLCPLFALPKRFRVECGKNVRLMGKVLQESPRACRTKNL